MRREQALLEERQTQHVLNRAKVGEAHAQAPGQGAGRGPSKLHEKVRREARAPGLRQVASCRGHLGGRPRRWAVKRRVGAMNALMTASAITIEQC